VRWLRFAPIVALVAIRVLLVGAILDDPAAYRRGTAYEFDAHNYHSIAERAGTPHVDFEMEFPPVSLAYIELVNGDTVADTMHNLGWAGLGLELLAAVALAYGWGKRTATVYLVFSLPFLLYPFFYWRIDMLSVALAVWGLALAKRHRQVLGGGVLALAAFAKFWPLGLVPVLALRRQWRALVTCCSVMGAIGIAWVAWAGLAGPEQVMTFRHATGWQIESVVGAAQRVFTDSTVFKESGALRTGSAPQWATVLLGLALVAVVAGAWWRAAKARALDDATLDGVVPVVAVTAFLVCSPLLSPQYLVWLLPFAAICWVTGARRVAVLVGIALVLTMLVIRTYHELKRGDLGPQVLLQVRNAVLVLTLVEGYASIGRVRSTEVVAPSPALQPAGAPGA
jgi:hypothetical protein